MILKRYTRHRKPTGVDARVTIAELRAAPAESSLSATAPKISSTKTTGREDGVPEQNAIAAVESVLRVALPIGPGIQLTCPGFLSNARQHRMFGLASLEVAQLARRHWDSLKTGGPGAFVPNAGSSARQPRSSAGNMGTSVASDWKAVGGHLVGYRDVFDVAVRWRQLSEPNDPVWWIDRLTPEAFQEGFGLQTPIVNGQLKV